MCTEERSALRDVTERMEELSVPADTGLGFMEFFDWLAGTSNRELLTLAKDHGLMGYTGLEPGAMVPLEREHLGLAVWRCM